METVGEERVRATNSLRQLEEAAQLLEDASKSQNSEKISSGFPARVSGMLNELTAISSREDAERLLATGVSMWNSVIAFESPSLEQGTSDALVKVRHVAADCMYMSTTVLGGISARYNIDDLSLMKFYTACGQKYAVELRDPDMADVCFTKAAEFAETATTETRPGEAAKTDFARAMFDLNLGRAECAWEKGDSAQAETYVTDAGKYLDKLPEEYEFLASVEYNFGLFTYQAKETQRALRWLKRSMQTRGSEANKSQDLKKQARTARLAGVCLLALQDYEESWSMMKRAEEMCHDPVGMYLLLKLSVISKKPQALDLLAEILEDVGSSLDICIASVSLFSDAQRVSDACLGYEKLFRKFQDDAQATVSSVGPKYFEALTALGKTEKALEVLEVCASAIDTLTAKPRDVGDDEQRAQEECKTTQISRWSALLLAAGSAQADRKDFSSAVEMLSRALRLARRAHRETPGRNCEAPEGANENTSNVVLENEAAVCRLASSCALCSIERSRPAVSMSVPREGISDQEDGQVSEQTKRMSKMSIEYALRAKELEPKDFTPRLLLFRAYLVSRNFFEAAHELQLASTEIQSFDPGALAEAACAARDVGSTQSVVAALRCILKLDPEVVTKGLESCGAAPPKGFIGTVLLSCVNLLVSKPNLADGSPLSLATEGDISAQGKHSTGSSEELLDILRSGHRLIRAIGIDSAFDEKLTKTAESLTYLVDVAWNAGREAGMALRYATWEAFFELCYAFSSYLPPEMTSLQTRRMSKLMCACAIIENPSSDKDAFKRAANQVKEARRLSQMLQEMSPTAGGDPIEALLLPLEARCYVGCCHIDFLCGVVAAALQEKAIPAGALEQLAAICYNYPKSEDVRESELRVRCADLTTALLSKASDVRLSTGKKDVHALAITIREHLGIELSRGANSARSFTVFQKATGIVVELSESFPDDERRWLVAVGWDRAQMHNRVGQHAEAKRWCQGVAKLCAGHVALSTYQPRLNALLESLGTGLPAQVKGQ